MSGFPTRILAATDGSEDAALALRAASDLSSSTGSELHVVHVWPGPPIPVTRYSARDDPRKHEMKARELLERQVSRAKVPRGIITRKHLKEGRPAEEIVELAEELDVGLVVIGSRGLNAVKRLVVGSVSA